MPLRRRELPKETIRNQRLEQEKGFRTWPTVCKPTERAAKVDVAVETTQGGACFAGQVVQVLTGKLGIAKAKEHAAGAPAALTVPSHTFVQPVQIGAADTPAQHCLTSHHCGTLTHSKGAHSNYQIIIRARTVVATTCRRDQFWEFETRPRTSGCLGIDLLPRNSQPCL